MKHVRDDVTLSTCSAGCHGHAMPGEAVDLSQLSGVGRRTFLVQSAIMAAAAALAACGGAASDSTAPVIPTNPGGTNGQSNNVITVGNYPALASVGGVAMLSVGGAPIAIVRTGTSSFLALSRICPHQGGTVQQYGTGFACPVHGARFSNTGGWIGGQPTSSLHQYNAVYDAAAGTLTVG